ncbi:hypothetical protein ZEAMMB73_Zm00001d003553 [Zea mays]|jgi:hypothetical protein|uniref:Uncharacterized protein n=1 Tax=Zea mays TaxID=4577 RepID=A0A1D6E9S7_MAIZE|nr:hypothetical protein ZEAMMB73_Zm00001d003553 [Zea mays]|eukprot:XP_020404436.1 scarecrow-like protein 34 [Zea mays]
MEPTAAQPRSFSNLSPTPDLDGSQDDNVLPFISRMLMEDDGVDEFLYQQYPDHNPALLQTQQLFAQVLSDTSTNALTALQAVAHGSDLQDPSSLNSTATGAVEPASILLPAEGSSCCKDAVSMAFFRGMEEANKFLPGDGGGGYTVDCRGRKKRLDGDDEGEGRSSKQMAADGEESEESAAREMLDRLMLNGDDEPMLADIQELRAAMDMAKTLPGRPGGRAHGVDLHSMLLHCADALASNNRHSAADLLARIRRHSSLCGDATQRLAHWFAEGLELRLNGTGSLHYRSSSLMAKSASCAGAPLKAQQFFMASCCFLPVSILFANKTIYNAAAGRKKLHIVHYGLEHGLQWASLLRWLAHREGGPPEVRLTGIDVPQPGFRPARLIEEAGRRVHACARRLGVPFRFRGIASRPEAVRAGDLGIDPDEVLVICSMFHFRTLADESTDDPIGVVLGAIREMRPAVFVHAVLNASYSTAFFATRFRELLYNFTALFDMMDAILPRDNGRRLLFEREVLARCAVNAIACEGAGRAHHTRSYKQWQARSRRAGLRQLPLDGDVVRTLRDKVSREYHEGFVITEDQQWLLQGWKGRVLYAISTWTADDGLAGN